MEGMEKVEKIDVSHLIEEGGETLEGEGAPGGDKAVWQRQQIDVSRVGATAPPPGGSNEDIYGKVKVDKLSLIHI